MNEIASFETGIVILKILIRLKERIHKCTKSKRSMLCKKMSMVHTWTACATEQSAQEPPCSLTEIIKELIMHSDV